MATLTASTHVLPALGLGTLAALLWAASVLVSAPVSRGTTTGNGFFWTSTVGAGVALAAAAATGLPLGTSLDWSLVVVAGLGYACAASLWLVVVRRAAVTMVVPIVATDGAIAATFAALGGSRMPPSMAAALGCTALGIVLVTRARAIPAGDSGSGGREHRSAPRSVSLAICVAACFATVFLASGETTSLNPLWVVAGAKSVQAALALPRYIGAGRPALPRTLWLKAAICGGSDVGGYVAFVVAARLNLPTASVAASQYAAASVIGGVLVLRERLEPRQAFGVVLILIAIGWIAATG